MREKLTELNRTRMSPYIVNLLPTYFISDENTTLNSLCNCSIVNRTIYLRTVPESLVKHDQRP